MASFLEELGKGFVTQKNRGSGGSNNWGGVPECFRTQGHCMELVLTTAVWASTAEKIVLRETRTFFSRVWGGGGWSERWLGIKNQPSVIILGVGEP